MEEDAEFDRFFDEHYPIVIKALMHRGYRLEEARDAGSEAMVGLYKNWGTVQNRLSYAFTVAFRTAAGEADRRRRDQALAAQQSRLGDPSPDTLIATEDQLLFVELLSGLPEAQGKVLTLDLAGFKGPEIARILGVEPDTVRSNRRHGIRRLRTEVERRGIRFDEWGC